MLLKTRNDKKGFTISETLILIVILAIVAAIAIPKHVIVEEWSGRSAARGVAGVMSYIIAEKHADYLKSGSDYTVTNVVSGTRFGSGIASPSVEGNVITWDYWPKTFKWTYFPRDGDTSAYLTEDSSSAFGILEPTPWYEIAMKWIFRL